MDQMDAVPVRGTEGGNPAGGRSPFFSPDGTWLGFWQDDKLKKVAVTGGAPVTLCDAENPYGASWTEENTIVYGQGSNGIWQVSGNGGAPELLVAVEDGELAHGPELLPGGGALLFTLGRTLNWDEASVVVQSLATGERRTLIEGGSDARYLPTGHIVYALGPALFAVPFDVARLAITGGPVSVLDEVRRAGDQTAAAQFSVSRSGTLLYVPGAPEATSELVWVDRDGNRAPLAGSQAGYASPRLSPDGRRLAVRILAGGESDIWILDLERDTSSRLTVGGQSAVPVWSPDGEWVAFRSTRSGKSVIYRRRADFSGEAELLLEAKGDVEPEDWSGDGWILYNVRGEDGSWDVWAKNLDGSEEPQPVVQSPFLDVNASFSSDRRWVVYLSDASGRFEVYATPFPNSGRRYQISTSGGTDPVWSREGDQIFYMSDSRTTLMAVDVETDPEFRAGSPRELFDANFYTSTDRDYDVAPDGDRFAVVVEGSTAEARHEIHVVTNWFQELNERVPIE
jgi:serine/threonine-protein kinase